MKSDIGIILGDDPTPQAERFEKLMRRKCGYMLARLVGTGRIDMDAAALICDNIEEMDVTLCCRLIEICAGRQIEVNDIKIQIHARRRNEFLI